MLNVLLRSWQKPLNIILAKKRSHISNRMNNNIKNNYRTRGYGRSIVEQEEWDPFWSWCTTSIEQRTYIQKRRQNILMIRMRGACELAKKFLFLFGRIEFAIHKNPRRSATANATTTSSTFIHKYFSMGILKIGIFLWNVSIAMHCCVYLRARARTCMLCLKVRLVYAAAAAQCFYCAHKKRVLVLNLWIKTRGFIVYIQHIYSKPHADRATRVSILNARIC